MKIKTITCHDVYNSGASLQAYALVTYLRSLGHDAEIIDYKPDYLSHHFPLWGLNNPAFDMPIVRVLYKLAKLPGRIKNRTSRRKREYDDFKRDYLPVTAKQYRNNEELKHNPPKADAYLAGSDQIWNCFFQNGRDPAFYLDFAPKNAVKASYAASFATEDIPDEWKPQVRKWLSGLDAISVRESSGAEIIKQLGICGAEQVLDPVFLLTAEHWEKIEKPIKTEYPYVLYYDFDQNKEMLSAALQFARAKGWRLYSIFPCKQCDRSFEQEGPCTFLWLVRNAQFVISNSFHATAFSLIFHKEFAVCRRKEGINTRMVDLLELVGLDERLVSGNELKDLKPIDYNVVDIKIEGLLTRSKEFLERALQK